MRYRNYTVADFLADENFKSWVLHPTKESDFFWESLLANHPEISEKIEKARNILESLSVQNANSGNIGAGDMKEVFHRILDEEKAPSKRPKRFTQVILSNPGRVAAVFVLLISILIYYQARNTTETPDSKVITWIDKSNPKGRMSTIRLPDKSEIRLGPDSRIRYKPSLAGDKREIWLEGEAFFQVRKDSLKPFVVHSENLQTIVLGTSFNIRAFNQESSIQIALVEGKVLVRDDMDLSEKLVPNQKLIFSKETGVSNRQPLDYDSDIAWKDGILVLKDASMSSLKKTLELWYNVEVELKELSGDYQFNGRFERKSLEYVINSLAYTSDLEYSLEGKKLIISSK